MKKKWYLRMGVGFINFSINEIKNGSLRKYSHASYGEAGGWRLAYLTMTPMRNLIILEENEIEPYILMKEIIE